MFHVKANMGEYNANFLFDQRKIYSQDSNQIKRRWELRCNKTQGSQGTPQTGRGRREATDDKLQNPASQVTWQHTRCPGPTPALASRRAASGASTQPPDTCAPSHAPRQGAAHSLLSQQVPFLCSPYHGHNPIIMWSMWTSLSPRIPRA